MAAQREALKRGPHHGRLDDQWTVYSDTDGVPYFIDIDGGFPGHVEVASDGSVWMAPEACAGVTRFDGATWTTFLDGVCVGDLTTGRGGMVWLLASDDRPDGEPFESGRIETYVITPEAVAGTE